MVIDKKFGLYFKPLRAEAVGCQQLRLHHFSLQPSNLVEKLEKGAHLNNPGWM